MGTYGNVEVVLSAWSECYDRLSYYKFAILQFFLRRNFFFCCWKKGKKMQYLATTTKLHSNRGVNKKKTVYAMEVKLEKIKQK